MKHLIFKTNSIQKSMILFLLFSSGCMMSQKLDKKIDSVSYALGVASSRQVKSVDEGLKKEFGLTLNKSAYLLGFENAVDNKNFKISVDKSKKMLIDFIGNQRELAKKRNTTNTKASSLPISSDASLKTEMDSVSYALGVKNGGQIDYVKKNIKNTLGVAINVAALKNGYISKTNSSNVKISEADSKKMLDAYFKKKQKEVNEKNKKEGEDFLVKNKSNKGVKTTASGLQYLVIKEGSGKKPVASSKVKVHYHGTLINGRVFDSSVKRKKPNEFPVNAVIKGWTEGLQLMKVGAKYKFYIPQKLAYGAKAPSPEIKPYSTLIFEVELLEVK